MAAYLIATNDIFMDPYLPFLHEYPYSDWKRDYNKPIKISNVPSKSPCQTIIDRLQLSEDPLNNMYIPESIVNIRSSRKRTREGQLSKKGLAFRVRWKGYPSQSDHTWESYQHLKDNLIFHQYCRMNHLEYLIPSCYCISIKP